MDDFGAKLRQARERRGISLRQIASSTKIAAAALDALEKNDISKLPGGIFSRAFVRSYATEVGLDPEKTIQAFIAQFPNDSVTAGHPTSQPVEDSEALESDRRMAGTFIWLIAISVPIAGTLLYFAAAGRRVVREAPPPPAVAAPAPETKPETRPSPPALALASGGSATAAAVLPPVDEDAAPPAVAATTGDHMTASLVARRPCWVSATVDGQRAIASLLQTGEQKTVTVRREMVLTVGDASAITLSFNGAEARPLGKAGEVVTARFNLTNFKDYLQTP
jgi:cytoskeleton protein RodZ